jgi:hypothetical protein
VNKFQLLRRAALVSLLALGGCGGGGGSGSVAPPTPAPPPADTRTGLVPDAGAPGAILYAEAASLRVLREHASWTYHGIDQQDGEASTATAYEYFDTVKHTAVAGAIVEQGSNPLNAGPDAGAVVRYAGGAYLYADRLSLSGSRPPLPIDVIELRSPVRVNDQYTSFDKRVADSGSDFDGDKVNDPVDIAVYARVAGEELVDLPNRLHVKAVRVDMVVRLRAVSSKTGEAGPVFTSLRSTWYAPGVGIVKMRSEEPNIEQPTRPNRVVTEELQNYDGGTNGLGHTASAQALFPAAGSGAGVPLPVPFDALAFDTTAVVLSPLPGDRASAGFTVGQLDQRGAVLAARTYTLVELFGSPSIWAAAPRLLRVGDELRILTRTDLGIQMVGLDATGQRITVPARVLQAQGTFESDGDYAPFQAAADGSGFWLAWLRTSPGPASLVLQRFDSGGAAQGSAQPVAANVVPIFLHNIGLAVSEKRVAVSWLPSVLGDTRRFAVLDKSSGALLPERDVAAPQPACTKVVPLALQPGMALACYSGYSNINNLSAARLDATGAPLLLAGGTLADEHLKADWLTALGRPVFAGLDGQLVAAGFQGTPYWWRARGTSGFLMVMQTSGTGALTTEPTLLARIPGGIDPRFVLGLGNRMLIVGGEDSTMSGGLRTMVVWRPN